MSWQQVDVLKSTRHTPQISYAVVDIAFVLSTVDAEKIICCTATALFNVENVAIQVVFSIDAIEKDWS